MMNPIHQTAVAGVSGYAGAELARLLLHHPRLADWPPIFFGRPADPHEEISGPVSLAELHPQLAGSAGSTSNWVEPFQWDALREKGVSLIFLATPHEQSRAWVPRLLDFGIRVIDLSGAWRLQESANREVYHLSDAHPAVAASIQKQAIYGIPELHRKQIAAAQLVANPGCYATSIILALAPLLADHRIDLSRGIICDSKSGVSGAGKTPTSKTHFMNAADNLWAYSPFIHRHTGELLEQLGLDNSNIVFTPHLLPIPRGIMSTIYLTLREPTEAGAIEECFLRFFSSSPMVRWFGTNLPAIQYSVRTNYCDLGFALASDRQRLIVVSCLDNLLKGAAGQAVQNMNLLFGWPEQEGLT
ncbi:MAG TPA: N-acetyl-gamma-glutamyl-phosphate reductase [Acidobacteriaceae bacterium]|nr:N-acetyl-gamma-glutamyl-phosphate reductase [Acidobacteriaceae bacterium]